ncbi:MAG: hypothetical protein IPK76_23400 [Lewinellaceae bacterium]|jgi:hypothetical protein|nr:hypothetical protein [Lewinellaceae bacterium]
MKAVKGASRMPGLLLAGLLLLAVDAVQAQTFSSGKSLSALKYSLQAPFQKAQTERSSIQPLFIRLRGEADLPPVSLSMLPSWSAECLPFFCRIEYRIAKGNAVPFKFRLGSVDYVDWLEGKPQFHTFAPQ